MLSRGEWVTVLRAVCRHPALGTVRGHTARSSAYLIPFPYYVYEIVVDSYTVFTYTIRRMGKARTDRVVITARVTRDVAKALVEYAKGQEQTPSRCIERILVKALAVKS